MNDEKVTRLEEQVRQFLEQQRIAVWGLEEARSDPGQMVARKFRKRGVEVIGVNPELGADAGSAWVTSLTGIDPPVAAVLVYMDRDKVMPAIDDCVAARTPLVWLHDALSAGSATEEAIDRLRSAGCTVIPGLCPMFFLKPIDPAHFCLRWVLRLNGKEKRTQSLVL